MTEQETHYVRRIRSKATWKEWILFLSLGMLCSAGIGTECVKYLKRLREEDVERGRVLSLRSVSERHKRELRRLGHEKGREMKVRERGGIKPGERRLPSPEAHDND
jgi:hypothetical protein